MSLEEVVDRVAEENLDGVQIRASFVYASCPFHGVDAHPSFWISRETGKWGCWACSASGSSLKWLLKELGLKRPSIEYILDAAEKESRELVAVHKARKHVRARANFLGTHTLPENILGLWDMCPTDLLDEGFDQEILKAHDIGFDPKNQRITFPIRDIEGSLIGVSGRSTDGSWPKYKVYQGFHDVVLSDGRKIRAPGELGAWFPDYSSSNIRDHLYRGHVVYPRCFEGDGTYVIVVEGYKAALWMVQMGYQNTVALMGARMSQTQERLIRRMGVPTFILLDNNDPGHEGADSICDRLGNCTFPVYRCWYPEDADEDTQPSDLSEGDVEYALDNSTRAVKRLKGKRKWQSP